MRESDLSIYDLSPRDKKYNTRFSRNVCEIIDVMPKKIRVEKFRDGDTDIVINDSVRDQEIFVFQNYIEPIGERKYELELFLDAVTFGGNNRGHITVVLPYAFGSRGERRTRSRQASQSLVFAKSLKTFKVDTLLTGAIHAESVGIAYNAQDIFFEHLEFETVAANYIMREYCDAGRVAITSPDVGGLKRVRKLDKIINDPKVREMEGCNLETITISADKVREKANEIKSSNILDSVEGYDVIIVDDIGDTLGTLINAAKNCKVQGAKSVKALLYHPVLGKGYGSKLDYAFEEGILDELVLGNTIPLKEYAFRHEKVKIIPFEPLFAQAIKSISGNRSMSPLYDYNDTMKHYARSRMIYKHDPKYVRIEPIKRDLE
jgi:ribose-phosphate pyrophosphokinase